MGGGRREAERGGSWAVWRCTREACGSGSACGREMQNEVDGVRSAFIMRHPTNGVDDAEGRDLGRFGSFCGLLHGCCFGGDRLGVGALSRTPTCERPREWALSTLFWPGSKLDRGGLSCLPVGRGREGLVVSLLHRGSGERLFGTQVRAPVPSLGLVTAAEGIWAQMRWAFG